MKSKDQIQLEEVYIKVVESIRPGFSDVNTTVNATQINNQKFFKRIDQIIELENSIQLKRRRDLMEAMLSTLTDEQYAKFQTRYRELLRDMEYSPSNVNLKEMKKAWEYIFTK